jgi:hypothetical protein
MLVVAYLSHELADSDPNLTGETERLRPAGLTVMKDRWAATEGGYGDHIYEGCNQNTTTGLGMPADAPDRAVMLEGTRC